MEISKYSALSVLVAGCGAIGKRHIDILQELGVGDIMVCDPNTEYVKAVTDKYPNVKVATNYAEGLKSKPFAVFILTPTKMHIPMAIEAIKSGAHVFIEKPLSNSSEDIEKLKQISKEYDKQVMVGFCFRYHDAMVKVKRLLEQGEIGRVVSVRSLMGEDFPSIHPEYKEMYISKYSGAFEIVHDVDLAIWMSGQEVDEVYGVYGSFSDYEFESPDTAEILIKLKNKAVATVHLDFFQNPRRRNLEIIGVNGVITIEFSSWDEATVSMYNKFESKWKTTKIATKRNDMFIAEDSEFLDLAMKNEPMRCNIDQASASLLVIEKIYKPY